MANDWTNADGLYIKFGPREAEASAGGEFADGALGNEHYIEFLVSTEFLDSTNTVFLSDTLTLPGDCFLYRAEFEVEIAFDSTGEGATLTFGLYDTDRTTAYDADGIDATIAESAIDAVGDTITCDGALVGTRLANNTPCLVTAVAGTEAFTAGKGRLKLWYYF